jgi:hypothetical protein
VGGALVLKDLLLGCLIGAAFAVFLGGLLVTWLFG